MKRIEQLDMVELTAQQPFAYWLHKVEKIGRAGKEKLIEIFGSPQEIFCAGEKQLQAVLQPEQVERIKAAKQSDVYKEYGEMLAQGILFYPYYHPAYPGRLSNIPDRPFGIYVKGRLPETDRRSVAIVGARNCSEYGRFVAENFAKAFAAEGIQVISGMAKGVDGIAQQAVLEAGGDTYGVLGCGADICYPAVHRQLYHDICANGGILSTYPPKTPPLASYFPPRNRIISGLSDVVLVVEARNKSGTLITVDMALEQGREVYVVPGRITDRLSDGCNKLLLQGAGVALSPTQMIEELMNTVWCERKVSKGRQPVRGEAAENTEIPERKRSGKGSSNRKSGSSPLTVHAVNHLSEEEQELLSLLDFYPISLDQIRMMMQTKDVLCTLTLPQTMEMLLKLSMEGYVKNEGGYYGLAKPVQ